MYYFAYGSNMLRSRIENRVGRVNDLGQAELPGYKIVFNKRSSSGSGKANVIVDSTSKVFGVVYDLTLEQIKNLDLEEKNYSRIELFGKLRNEGIKFMVYVANSDVIGDNLLPTKKYLDYIINGAKEHNLPREHVLLLEREVYSQ